jgi:quinohemoprotein ethanol dehydrogenase
MRSRRRFAAVTFCLVLAARAAHAETVVDDRALGDESQGANWLSYGRTYSERRFSPLTQIDTTNVGKLGLAWVLDLPTDRSLLSTPLVVDGVLYFTGTFSVTRAVDANTGKLLWEYDPKTIEHSGDRLRIFWGSSRGAAYWKGTLVIATNDGRLIGLDAKTGKERWTTQTTDVSKPLYISGYPKAFRGKVLVGNGGTEHGAARGYVSAYDIEMGKQAWRFYIVPGNPADGFEDEAQEMAAKTWKGESSGDGPPLTVGRLRVWLLRLTVASSIFLPARLRWGRPEKPRGQSVATYRAGTFAAATALTLAGLCCAM